VVGQSDEVLMEMVQNGNLDKSSVLFERYQTKVYNYFLRMTFNKDLSMDLAQNTFYRMLHYRKTYNTNLSFKSWLFGIARNVFYDSTKQKFNNTTTLEKVHNEQNAQYNEAVEQFENEALHQALGALSSEDRDIIIMSRFENMKYNEIAEIQGLTLSAVKVKVHRAIKKLREYYFKDNIRADINVHSN